MARMESRAQSVPTEQVFAAAVAAVFLGIGLAGEPLMPLRALIAAVLVVGAALALSRLASPLLVFLLGFFGVILTHFLQNEDPYLLGTGVVALALGGLAAASYGRRLAPLLIVVVAAIVAAGLFFGGVPSGY
jgi:hypothetical protein